MHVGKEKVVGLIVKDGCPKNPLKHKCGGANGSLSCKMVDQLFLVCGSPFKPSQVTNQSPKGCTCIIESIKLGWGGGMDRQN